ncbi:MAG: M23 family metallopeptidase [Actinobacteria bacterium]|nr:M23 family metallopeptidase [Actinomycetota bacterium]MCA1722483.1 M23 family metallopeptidase [Actinomycetota bacterium]
MSSPDLLRRKRRGDHGRPSRSARYMPALLLLVPAGSMAGLRSTHSTSPAHLEHLRLAGSTTPVAPGAVSAAGSTDAADYLAGLAAPRPQVKADPPEKAVRVAAPARQTTRAARTRTASLWVLPTSGRLSSRYGPRWGSFHPGIDIAAPTGDPVKAAAAGVVTTSGWSGGYGKLIRIQHRDGTTTTYAHLSRILVAKGQRVTAGEVIGKVGSTGYSTGPHLHFEVRVGSRAINPLPWLHAHGVTFYGSATDAAPPGTPATHPQD